MMKLKNLLVPFDAYERNKKIASLLDKSDKVLDVGGGITGIKIFTNNSVKTLDLYEGDIKADARTVDLPEQSFDVVTAVDVLEHIPPKDRNEFIDKISKLAKNKIIISAPYGSKEHILAEKKLLKRINKKKINVTFLEEHVKNGLPHPDDIKAKKLGKNNKIFYSGDFRFSNSYFLFNLFEFSNPYLNKSLYYFKVILNFLFNFILYPFWFYSTPRKYANRYYIVIER